MAEQNVQNPNVKPEQPVAPQEPATPPIQPQPAEPTPPSVPPVEPKKSKFSIVTILIIVVAVSVYAAVASQMNVWPFSSGVTSDVTVESPTPTPDAIANWKTYRNDEYEFEFRYPPSLNLNNLRIGDYQDIEPGPGAFSMEAAKKRWQRRLSNEDLYSVGDVCVEFDGDLLPRSREECTIVSVEPLSIRVVFGETDEERILNTTYTVVTDNFEIAFFNQDISAEEFLQILSTFRFTEPAPTVGMAELSPTKPFSSEYFTLSFEIPSDFGVFDLPDRIAVYKEPRVSRPIGDDNAFLELLRYHEFFTREQAEQQFRVRTRTIKNSQILVDGTSFLRLDGTDIGSFEGDSAGRVVAIFFDASVLLIRERPLNQDQEFDPITVGISIVNTFRFSK